MPVPQDGGMVGLMAIDNRLRFDVNLKAVRKAGLDPDGNQVPGLPVAVLMGAFASSVGQQAMTVTRRSRSTTR